MFIFRWLQVTSRLISHITPKVLYMSILALLLALPVQAASKRIGIVVFDGVLGSDITAPIEVFGVASKKSWFSDYETVTINVSSSDIITTEEGLSIKVDAHINDAPQVDVLLVPSSYDMSPIIENKALISYVKNTAKHAEWMASNCSGALVLAEAGVLDGRSATTWAGGEKGMAKAYPNVNVKYDINYVIDGNVITSNGSVVSYQAALALLERLSSKGKADEVRDALQMTRVWK